MFWGESAALLNEWLSFVAPGGVRDMSRPTWLTMCVVQREIERATGFAPTTIPKWLGGGSPMSDAQEADFRAVAQILVAQLVADQYDVGLPGPHTHSVPAWFSTTAMEPGATDILIGGAGGPGPAPSSVLGRIRAALGS